VVVVKTARVLQLRNAVSLGLHLIIIDRRSGRSRNEQNECGVK